MNSKLFSTALVLSLAAGSALAAGADGPSFPSLQAAQAAAPAAAHVHAEASQVQRTSRVVFVSADGSVHTIDAAVPAARSRDAVKAEVIEAIRVGAIGNANTPY